MHRDGRETQIQALDRTQPLLPIEFDRSACVSFHVIVVVGVIGPAMASIFRDRQRAASRWATLAWTVVFLVVVFGVAAMVLEQFRAGGSDTYYYMVWLVVMVTSMGVLAGAVSATPYGAPRRLLS